MDTKNTPLMPPAAGKAVQLPESVKRLLTTREAAAALAMGLRSFCRLMAAGGIEIVKIGKTVRISQAAVSRFIEGREARINPKRRQAAKKAAAA
jgi:excisionase family DNA binding protein